MCYEHSKKLKPEAPLWSTLVYKTELQEFSSISFIITIFSVLGAIEFGEGTINLLEILGNRGGIGIIHQKKTILKVLAIQFNRFALFVIQMMVMQ